MFWFQKPKNQKIKKPKIPTIQKSQNPKIQRFKSSKNPTKQTLEISPKTKTKVKKTRQTQEEIKAYHHEYYKKYKAENYDKIQAQKDIYYSENKDKLTLIGVNNGEKVVKPTLETVSNGTYSPLSRPLFIYVNSTSVKSKEVVEFVNFYIDNAGELSTDVGYIPLPKENYAKQKENFKTFVENNK